MKKLLLVFVSALLGLIVGCVDDRTATYDSMNDIVYVKDGRTNVCFAAYRLGYTTGSITAVQCTPEVEQEIAREQSQQKK